MKHHVRTSCLAVYAIMILSLVTPIGPVHAGDTPGANGNLFMGLRYGNQDIDMQTRFTRKVSGAVVETSGFTNAYTANSGGLFVGYTLPYKRCYLSGQVFFDAFDDEFTLSAGSSRFTNTLNHAFGIELMPGIYLYKGLSLFGKIGLAYGEFDFVKSSPTSTVYDAQRNLYGYTLGAGLAYDITPRVTVKTGVERTRYEDTRIDATRTVLSDQTVVEPQMDAFFLTLQYNFN